MRSLWLDLGSQDAEAAEVSQFESWPGIAFATLDEMLESESPGWFKVPEDWPQYRRIGCRWYIRATSGLVLKPWGSIGTTTASSHQIAEHEDGTITVEPSLVMPNGWHGFLRAGVFTDA